MRTFTLSIKMCLDASNPYSEGVVTASLLHEMYSRIQSDDFVEL